MRENWRIIKGSSHFIGWGTMGNFKLRSLKKLREISIYNPLYGWRDLCYCLRTKTIEGIEMIIQRNHSSALIKLHK